MNKIPILLLMLWAAVAVAEKPILIYQLTGAIQCVEGTGIPPDQAADLLRGQGVKVVSAARRKLPQHETSRCGTPTGEANVMEVSAADWSAFLAKNPDAGGYGLWVFDAGTVRIYMYDGTLQCGMGREIALEAMAKELADAGIEVTERYKGTDGLDHISVCGASTGAINIFVIDRDALPAARRLGYRLLVTREMTRQITSRDTKPQPPGMTTSSPSSAAENPPGPNPIPLLW
ncbi:hypothetical protein [Candidatus Thiosymbion oneisti]|uniref:hypothetical protein n=1 Tax=Candidatus Thiosymbion oneisti TaxID=589554 RepID=UPI00105EB640|nr:hypothetical protein [Candidatus Thiosymbion oneisti]